MLRGGRNRQDSGLKVTGRICCHLGTQKAECRLRLGGKGMKELSTVSGEWGVEPEPSEGAKGQSGGGQGRSTVTGCSRHLDTQPRSPLMEVLVVPAPGCAVSATEITSTANSQLYGSDPPPSDWSMGEEGQGSSEGLPCSRATAVLGSAWQLAVFLCPLLLPPLRTNHPLRAGFLEPSL